MAFLPALRGQRRPAVPETKTLSFADYYAGLVASGINIDAASARKRWSMERAVIEGFERTPWVFKAVDAIARAHLRTPFVFMDGEDVVEDHPYYRLLNTGWANPLEAAHVFRKRLITQLMLSPRGVFVEETKSNAGTPVRLDLLAPGRTAIVPGRGADLIAYYETTGTDGVRRPVDPEKVRWIRDPHPTDPFGAMTPLEAAGLSVELDYFARLYNVSFMRNDARPGGIIGIDGDMDDADMERLEGKFASGPVEAGRVQVVAGDVSYVDVAARPRDIQYGTLSKNAKDEILAAFGTPESQLGNASGRTFANADAEGEMFWQHTVVNVNSLVAAGFSSPKDDLMPLFDHSEVPEMQRAIQAARAEAKAEYEAGLRSIDEYRAVVPGLEAVDTAYTRALFIASGKTPIPTDPADAEALGLGAPTDPNAVAPAEGDPAEAPADPGAAPGDPAVEPVAAPDPNADPADPLAIPQFDFTIRDDQPQT